MISIYLAPLSKRTGDISLLTRYFLDLAAAKYSKNMSSVSSEAMRLIEAYEWLGNIRQLENLIGQIVITNNESEITPEMLLPEIRKGAHRVSTSFNS